MAMFNKDEKGGSPKRKYERVIFSVLWRVLGLLLARVIRDGPYRMFYLKGMQKAGFSCLPFRYWEPIPSVEIMEKRFATLSLISPPSVSGKSSPYNGSLDSVHFDRIGLNDKDNKNLNIDLNDLLSDDYIHEKSCE